MGHCARVNGMCKRCEGELPFAFTMAFQPIVDKVRSVMPRSLASVVMASNGVMP